MQGITIGLDIAKQVFFVAGVDSRGRRIVRQKLSRGRGVFRPACAVPSEAGGGVSSAGRVSRVERRLSVLGAISAIPKPSDESGKTRLRR